MNEDQQVKKKSPYPDYALGQAPSEYPSVGGFANAVRETGAAGQAYNGVFAEKDSNSTGRIEGGNATQFRAQRRTKTMLDQINEHIANLENNLQRARRARENILAENVGRLPVGHFDPYGMDQISL